MNLELLLTQISAINKKYEEIYKVSGENFNIFNLLDLSRDELIHSKIIAALLDPKGMHGKGNKFIELFLNCIKLSNFSTNNATVKTEKFIGYKSADNTSGGRLDISVTNDKQEQIFIENKIYAGDQSNQLLRYSNNNPQAHLIYLTLFGDDPSEYSTGKDKKIDYKPISYREHILKWLELCKLESIDNPLLRETLTQYIVLVKQLTGQARSRKMQKEYLDTILRDADNVSAAFIIAENLNDIKVAILKEKFEPLMKKLEKDLGVFLDIDYDCCFASGWAFGFYKHEWKHLKIYFEFNGANFQNLYYGILDSGISQDFDKYLHSLNYEHSEYWSLWRCMEQYRYWNKEFFTELCSNNYNIVNVFKNVIKEILLIVEDKGYEL